MLTSLWSRLLDKIWLAACLNQFYTEHYRVLVLFPTIKLDEGWDSGVQKMVNLLLIDTNHTENFLFKCKVVLFA